MLDISNKLTVFIISSGKNPNYDDCLAALKKQTVSFKIDIIKDYHPLSVAFQQMIIRCKTPYYVEVDEDMILHNNAIEKMYQKINESASNIAMIAFRLHDVHYDFDLYGVKIYKYDIFKNYPYNLTCLSCEVEQLERLKKGGYIYQTMMDILGLHSPKWNNNDIFYRYYNLMEKFKQFGYEWLAEVPSKLWEKLKKAPNENDLYALLGAYTSIIKAGISEQEKDFTQIKLPEYALIEGYMNKPTFATIYVTSKCNFKCDFCYRQNNHIEEVADTDTIITNQLLDTFPSIRGVCCCGFGEPFLNPHLPKIIKTLKARNIFSGLITNGSLLMDKLDELIINQNAKPGYISISLNAHDKNSHQIISKTDTYEKVLKGIELCLKREMDTYVTYVCTKESISNVPSFLKLCKSIGVKSVYVHNLLPHFKEENNARFWQLVLQKKDAILIEQLKQLPEADIVKKYPILIDQNETQRKCIFPWTSVAVNGAGSISVCNSVYPCNSANGSIRSGNSCWQSKHCREMRSSLMTEQKSACKKCFRNWEDF